MAAKPGSPQTKPSPAGRFSRGCRRRTRGWSAYLILGGLVAALVAPFLVALIVLDVILGGRVRMLHRVATPVEWIIAVAIGVAFLAAGIWVIVTTTRAIVRESVDIVRSKRTTGTVSHYVGTRKVRPDDEIDTEEWDVEFTDSSGRRRTTRYLTEPGRRRATAVGTPIRVRYRPNRPDDQSHIALRRTGVAPLVGQILLKVVILAVWLVMIGPLFALIYAIIQAI